MIVVTIVHDLLGKYDVGAQIDMVILLFFFESVRYRSTSEVTPQDETVWRIDGNINVRPCDFLTKRKMQVVVDAEESEAVSLDSGIPQGIVLGPLLFLCHINDLPDAVKSTVWLFADDYLLYRHIRTRLPFSEISKI